MLGVVQGRYPALDAELPAGSVLALYIDGLIEQPGQDIGPGMAPAKGQAALRPGSIALLGKLHA
jgi:hypothetical protein